MLPPWPWMEAAIRIDSTTDRSNEEMVRFLVPRLEAARLAVRVDEHQEGNTRFFNLVAFRGDPKSPDLLALHTHLDTVPAGDAKLWTSTGGDPFRLTKNGDKIHGLGAADVKLDFLCKLEALRNAPPGRPVVLVGTFGEERGLVGAMRLLERPDYRPVAALVGEPSNLEIIYAHKGHMIFSVELPLARGSGETKVFEGVAAHSGTPHLGKNAIALAMDYATRRKLAVARLDGGVASNIIPERCEAVFVPLEGRTIPPVVKLRAYLRKLEGAIGKKLDRRFAPARSVSSWTIAKSDGNRVVCTFDARLLPDVDGAKLLAKTRGELEKLGGRILLAELDPPLAGDRDDWFVKELARAAARAGLPVKLRTKPTSTEAALYGARKIPAVVFGPGISTGNVHKPNEHNLLSQLEAATRFYSAVLAP